MTITPSRLVGACLGLIVVGSALESVLLGVVTAEIGSSPSIPLAAWAPALWVVLVAPGAGVAAVLLVRSIFPGVGAAAVRKMVITVGLPLLALMCCVSILVWVLIGDLASAHVVDSGRPVSLWLEPGVYQVSQDPENGGFNDGPGDLSFLSVTGRSGPVEVTAVPSFLSPSDVGGLFLGAYRDSYSFASEGQFRIKSPGEYRLVNDDEAIYPAVLVSPPYGAVAERTLPWIAVGQAASWAIFICLARARGWLKRRKNPKFPTGREFWESWEIWDSPRPSGQA